MMASGNAVRSERVELLVPGMKCGGCMRKVETALAAIPGVLTARANLTGHRAAVSFDAGLSDVDAIVGALAKAGYDARPYRPEVHGGTEADREGRGLLMRIGVAGFAAMNVMLLSVSVWSGAEGVTRDLMHWISAMIALPAIAYAARPFFAGAFGALRHGRLNMDVPISLAILLSAGASLAETAAGGAHAYFDAGIMLTFFLLIGRYLEHRTRAQARSAAAELMQLTGQSAMVLQQDGSRRLVPVEELRVGMRIDVAPGERVPADGRVMAGRGEIDRSMITGESAPELATHGTEVLAGCMNLNGALELVITRTGDETMLAQIARLVDEAARGRSRYDRLADRIARIYAPAVHILAGVAFVGWWIAAGDAWAAAMIAVAVLIVTCPCALALAIPTVHTVASGALFRRGIFLKDGAALERLAAVDRVVFDKTGTLTNALPAIDEAPDADHPLWPVAVALAVRSRHPRARAIAARALEEEIQPVEVTDVVEHPGLGVEGRLDGETVRLGRPGWAGAETGGGVRVLGLCGETASFTFTEALRPGAVDVVSRLAAEGRAVTILSGDAAGPVADVAGRLGIADTHAALLPGEKSGYLSALVASGEHPLMVGDGLNDAPALSAAHVSMSPAGASDVAQSAADLVFTGERLDAVTTAIDIARTAQRRAIQSLGIALVYNAIAIPMAMAGLVTPLIAAVAMSGSSCLVVLNALRMRT